MKKFCMHSSSFRGHGDKNNETAGGFTETDIKSYNCSIRFAI